MARAVVAVCLVSADFLASKFIANEEIPILLERREREGMMMLPVLVRPCAWKDVRWLRGIQMLPRDGKSIAVDYAAREDEAFTEITELILKKIRDPEFRVTKPAVPWAAFADEYKDVDRLPKTGKDIFGRDEELDLLDEAWESETTNILSFVAWGGQGKSALVNKWVEGLERDNYRGAERVYAWSFYSQGTGERVASADVFIDQALRWFGDPAFADTNRSGWDKGQRLADLVQQQRTLLLLDGVEPLQSAYEHDRGQVKDPALRVLIEALAKKNSGLCVITTREKLTGLERFGERIKQEDLEQISAQAGRALLRVAGIRGTDADLEQATRHFRRQADNATDRCKARQARSRRSQNKTGSQTQTGPADDVSRGVVRHGGARCGANRGP